MIITVFNIDNNNTFFTNKHFIVISEESRDTEECSNDAENSALHHRNKLHLKCITIRQLFWMIIIFYHF